MKAKHLLLACMLLVGTSAMAVPDYFHKFQKGVKSNPMVIQDTFGDYIVLSNYTGYYFLNMNDTLFYKIEYPKEVAKLPVITIAKNEGNELTLRMSDYKEKKIFNLTVDKQLNVLSCEPVTPPVVDKKKKSTAPQGNKIYTEDGKYYVIMAGALDMKLKEKIRTGGVNVSLYSAADDTKLAEYAEDWTTPQNEFKVVQTILYQKDNKVLMNNNNIVYIMSERLLDLGEGDMWKGFKEKATAVGGCSLKVVMLNTNGEKRVFTIPDADTKHYISNMYVLSWEGDRLHMAGWYCNMDEKNDITGFYPAMTASPYVYQGAYSMIIDTKQEKVVKYEKAPMKIKTAGLCNGAATWLTFRDTEFSWFRFDDGWKFTGLGCRLRYDAYVTDEGDVIIPKDMNAYNTYRWKDEVWKTQDNYSNKTFIPFGYCEETQSYNFIVHDYDVRIGNGVYMRCIGKDRYDHKHVHWILDDDTYPISQVMRREKGATTLPLENIKVDYSVHKLSTDKALLFYVILVKNTYYYFYTIEQFPDIREIVIEETPESEVTADPEQKIINQSLGKSLRSIMGQKNTGGITE